MAVGMAVAARMILRIVGCVPGALRMKAVAHGVEEITRIAGRIRAIHRLRGVIAVGVRMMPQFIGPNVVVVVMLFGIMGARS